MTSFIDNPIPPKNDQQEDISHVEIEEQDDNDKNDKRLDQGERKLTIPSVSGEGHTPQASVCEAKIEIDQLDSSFPSDNRL